VNIRTFTMGPFATNTYLVEDEATGSAMLVDPTIASESIYDVITDNKLRVILVVNTHGHIDHTFGDAFFKAKTGAPLAIHEDDAPMLAAMKQQARMFGLEPPDAAQADRLLSDGEMIQVGDLSFKVIHTPGHTPGGICLYGHGSLIAGDTLFAGSIGRTDLPGGDYDALIASIKRRLFVLPDETVVYSGHGEPTTIGEEKNSNPFLG
jgi:hydroxyacylglutathione hydrolase